MDTLTLGKYDENIADIRDTEMKKWLKKWDFDRFVRFKTIIRRMSKKSCLSQSHN